MNTLIDIAATAAGLALDHARSLVGLVLSVTLLVGIHAGLHHVVTEQAATGAALDQLARPAVAQAQPAQQQQWIPVQ